MRLLKIILIILILLIIFRNKEKFVNDSSECTQNVDNKETCLENDNCVWDNSSCKKWDCKNYNLDYYKTRYKDDYKDTDNNEIIKTTETDCNDDDNCVWDNNSCRNKNYYEYIIKRNDTNKDKSTCDTKKDTVKCNADDNCVWENKKCIKANPDTICEKCGINEILRSPDCSGYPNYSGIEKYCDGYYEGRNYYYDFCCKNRGSNKCKHKCKKHKFKIKMMGDTYNGAVKIIKNKYTGSFFYIMDGKGIHTSENGNKYDGNWKDDKREGKGTGFYYKNGKLYYIMKGNWINNKFKNGTQTVYKINNNEPVKHFERIGNFTGHLMNGHGIFTYKNGNKYDGNWKDDKREGKGTGFYYKNGKLYYIMKGNWINNKFKNGTQTVYKINNNEPVKHFERIGNFTGHLMNGSGKEITYKIVNKEFVKHYELDGNFVKSSFKNGTKTVYKMKNDEPVIYYKLIGNFKNGKLDDGVGKMIIFKDDNVVEHYEVIYNNGKLKNKVLLFKEN